MGSGELEILRGWRGCQLDGEDCLSLEQILHSFSAPISEEHAWAVIHQVRQGEECDGATVNYSTESGISYTGSANNLL